MTETGILHLAERGDRRGMRDGMMLQSSAGTGAAVFVEPSVPGYQKQILGVEQWARLHVLDPRADGVEQIAEELVPVKGLASLHLLAAGAPGGMLLGSAGVSAGTLGLHARRIAAWARALAVDGEIIIHNGQIGRGESGEFLLRRLSDITQRAISATDRPLNSQRHCMVA